ncbi:hypothetical protein PMI21_03044 [Pseudomonas sp. GM18]|uniref:Tc toxin subunit A-related protein n=1 Tax=Pseudomonas sp. GM18 TaxID=1144324 RepID=UPI0002722A97|nr:neuraminidase-like domain-containing protein [Pseudomonas sp. GM18]EJM16117.1 hypothetical protein PMI21_03044 [Pseudomonas sp. GM18]
MATPQIDELKDGYIEAMAEAVLGQQLWSVPVTLRTPEDVSEHLLTDIQDKAQSEATEVSSIVRTLQRYIHSVFGGMEKGFENSHFEPEDLQYWHWILSHYSTWSANELLKDHASNYIEPPLRLNKTELFRTLEGSLKQMRLTDASVKQGLMEYTKAFQRICDLDVRGGYIDGADTQKARYYLIAQDRTSTSDYYLRSVKVELDNNSKKINPVNWDEWRKCDIVTAGTVVDIRCAIWLGLPVLVWCEWIDRQVDGDGVVQSPWTLVIQLAFSSLNDQWSAPLTLHRQEFEYDVSNGWLTVVSLGDGDPRDDRLAVCYTNRNSLDGLNSGHEIEIYETRDALFRKVPDDTATLLQTTFGRFKNAASLQQKVVPQDYSKVTVTPVVANLYLDAVYTREQGEDRNFYEVLRVRGRCDDVQESGRVLQRLSISWRAVATATSVDVRIVDAGEKQLRITLTTRDQPTRAHVVQLPGTPNKETIHSFAAADFKETSEGDGIWVATAIATLSAAALLYLLGRTQDEIRAGAGFSIDVLGNAVLNEQNQVVPRILYKLADFELDMVERTVPDPPALRETAELNGHYATPWRTYRRLTASKGAMNFPVDESIDFIFGWVPGGRRPLVTTTFSVSLHERARLYNTPTLDNTSVKGAQFLSFNNSAQALKHVRLNSEIGPVLTNSAAVSPDALLHWDTQHVEEKPLPDGSIEPNGPFDGCNGRYFWELFFHLPHLVGTRLSEEGRYHEAQQWFEYIFNPLLREIPESPGVIPKPAYWNCRPLKIDDVECSYESAAPTDPDAIGYCAPIHFMIAIFLHYVENLIAEGDDLYRQLDYDSMVRAGLLYNKARALIGEEPVTRTASTWKPVTLGTLVPQIEDRGPLKVFEAQLEFSLADVPLSMKGTPRLGLLGSGAFKAGLNERPKALWNQLNSRLNNLRSNLSIDGQPLQISLFKPPMDPRNLLIAQANGTLGAARNPGGQVQVVPYRWQTAYNLALQIVEFLIQQEEQLRSWLQQRDQGELEELQQDHLIRLADYTRSIHEAMIAQHESTAASLRQSESMVKARVRHYEGLVREGVSEAEYSVLEKNRDARYLAAGAGALRTVGAALDILPNIGGTAFGGMRPAAIPYAGAELLQLLTEVWRSEAEEFSINEGYRRRQQDWKFALDQSTAEARVLSEQLQAQDQATKAARASLQQTEMANTQAREVYAFYKRRSTGRELSNWVVGQLKPLLYQLYDLAVSHCVIAERCLQYEMGDFKARFIRSEVWRDAHHGFTSGASLKVDLLQMAAARIKRDERRLQMVKTISLKELDEDNWKDFKGEGKANKKGILDFTLNEKLFNQDYPGHYRRQVLELRFTFPGLLGPYQNVCATLTQNSSSTVLEPEIATVQYLHDGAGTPVPGSLVQNLRPYQQIGLSRGLDDNGIADWADDGRYRPFEGTGAHASYQLKFPRPDQPGQVSLLQSLTDIILTVIYQARDGGPGFASEVEGLLSGTPPADTSRVPGRVRKVQP